MLSFCLHMDSNYNMFCLMYFLVYKSLVYFSFVVCYNPQIPIPLTTSICQGQLLEGDECHIYLYCFTFVYINLNRAFVIIVLFPKM